MTPRPSMPPGHTIAAGEKPGGGKMDFCWLVWSIGSFSGEADGLSRTPWLRGRTRRDAAITHALNNAEPLAGLEQRFVQVLDGWEEDGSSPAAVSALQFALGCVRDAMHEVNAIQSRIADGRSDSPSPAIASPVVPSRDEERGHTFNDAQGAFEYSDQDIRWGVNYLLEQIAAKFETWDTLDLFRSEAAATVRSFKHDLAAQPPAAPVETATKSAPVLGPPQNNAERLPSSDAAGAGAGTQCSAGNVQEITSIVSRLRNFAVWNARHSHYDPVPLCKEAADLIERLTAVPQTPKVWMGTDPAALSDRLEAAYGKVKEWPERSATGFMNFLELRNLVPEAVAALRAFVTARPTIPTEPLQCLRCGTVDAFGPASSPLTRPESRSEFLDHGYCTCGRHRDNRCSECSRHVSGSGK
jgi:hypothetical protein